MYTQHQTHNLQNILVSEMEFLIIASFRSFWLSVSSARNDDDDDDYD